MVGEGGEGPLRVVVDPNVLVSAAISDGISRRVVQLAAAGGFRMVVCPHLLDELHRVLQREKFTEYRTREELDRFERNVGLLVVTMPDPEVIEAVTNDPDDDYLVALARERAAELICSGDNDFDDVTWPEIVTPGQLVRQLTTGT